MGVMRWGWAVFTKGRLVGASAQVAGGAGHRRVSSASSSGHLAAQSAKTLLSFVPCSDPFSLVAQGTPGPWWGGMWG